MMAVTKVPESLNKLITAIGRILGDKYTVCHTPGEHPLIEDHRVAVIDNDLHVTASITVPRRLVRDAEDDPRMQTKIASIISDQALRSISLKVEE